MITINTWALRGAISTDKGSSPTPEVIKADIHNMDRLIKSAVQLEEKLDRSLLLTTRDAATVQMLATIMAAQKQIVLGMLSQNPETAIAQLLAGSIESLAKQLELLQGWTDGGAAMFESALALMLAKIEEGGVQPEELEDLFQTALLEIMVNPEKYGLTDWYNQNKADISHILESTGSGSHGLHEGAYDTPKELADITHKLFEGILSQGNIPQGSLLAQVMGTLAAAGGANALSNQIENHYYDSYGWWTNGSNTDLSPMLRLFILSESLKAHSAMTQEEVEMILSGSVDDINSYINKTFGQDTLSWFLDSTQWQWQDGYNYPNGTSQIDWVGDGININDLTTLYSNFPGRALTDEDIKEINRIGDQVKMLQETLKYWIQICRDEYLAAVRNI
ncbi:hypothetical protein CKQ84_18970 [Shewanella sp. WE21]|jgi:hypothetical protein|uniref:hypothetical protein n=1 Tax=Shewanella sp. WE21 TaxID=2029986 RepID=UPI000CF74A94|nr:hypothetical protein [Shewanella sp. WE21]AVI67758.1 hypothetical protein CKQ84_18970 [Shewanella sp. WE21]